MKTPLALIALFLASLIAGFAQIPREIPLTADRFETYMLGRVNHLSGGISGNSVSGDGRYFSVEYKSDGNTKNIAAAVKQASSKLLYRVDPTEECSSFASWEIRLPNGNIWSVFSGGKRFRHVKDSTTENWQIPPEATSIPLEFGQGSFYFPGAIDGYMVIRDASGNQIDYIYLGNQGEKGGGAIYDEQIIINPAWFNLKGELYVRTSDGGLYIYNLAGGVMKPTAPVATAGFDTSITGFRTLPDNTASIAYLGTDRSLLIKYTVNTNVTIPIGTSPLPVKIVVVEKTAFDASPATAGTSYNSTGMVAFPASAGQTILVIIERPPEPRRG